MYFSGIMRQIPEAETKAERDLLVSNGWICAGTGWIDPLLFEEDGFLAPSLYQDEAVQIQRERDQKKLESTIEWQRASLLGVLSARKQGPIPLEQNRAALLFVLERRAIRLIENS